MESMLIIKKKINKRRPQVCKAGRAQQEDAQENMEKAKGLSFKNQKKVGRAQKNARVRIQEPKNSQRAYTAGI